MKQPNLQERLEYIMEKQGIKPKTLSLEAGLNETAIRDILKGRSKNPRTDTTRKIANTLGVRHEWLVDGIGAEKMGNNQHIPLNAFENTIQYSEKAEKNAPSLGKIPVLGQSSKETSRDYHLDFEKPQEWIAAHPAQQNAPDSFALYVMNNRMAPRYFVGELVYCHPTRPVQTGQDCLLLTKNGDGMIGVLQQQTDGFYVLSFYNEDKARSINMQQVQKLYPIVGSSKN